MYDRKAKGKGMERPAMTTNQLSTVITALQLGRKTGILTIERREGATPEEGTILFVQGQAVQAAIGPYIGTGSNIATLLASWQACRFLFVPSSPEDPTLKAHLVPLAQRDTERLAKITRKLSDKHRQEHVTGQDDMNYRPTIDTRYVSLGIILRILERKGFSRQHRRLILLIDGRRSITDLAILLRSNPDETRTLLADLWQAGLIQLSTSST
jgi:hypothetical protein